MKLQLLQDLYESGGLSHNNNLSIQGIVEGKVARMICTGTKEELVVLSDKTGYLITRISAEDLAKREKAERRREWELIVAGWFENENRPPRYKDRGIDIEAGVKLDAIEFYKKWYRKAAESGALYQNQLETLDPGFLDNLRAAVKKKPVDNKTLADLVPPMSARVDANISEFVKGKDAISMQKAFWAQASCTRRA